MSRDFHEYRVEISADLGAAADQPRAEPQTAFSDTPFCIALLGDFSGRANRGIVEIGRTLAGRRPMRVDRDNLEEVLARIAPTLRLPLGDARSVADVRFLELDDFHPDRLYERLPRFQALGESRQRAATPGPRGPGRETAGGPRRRSTASGSLLDEILGDVPVPPGGANASAAHTQPTGRPASDPVAEFARRAVAPHVVADATPARPELVAEVDAAIGAEMRALLHHPDFQALEAAWRSVDFLVRRLETDASLRIYLIDVSKAELTADLTAGATVSESGVHRLLVDTSVGAAGATPWGLLVGLFAFGTDEADVALLRRLAAVARSAGAPWLAAAHPSVFGCSSFGTTPDPDDWSRADTPEWHALRRDADVRYVGLAAPRFLLRLPYGGADGQPTDVPRFEELSGPDAHEEYLWGNSAVLCALLFGEAFVEQGWALRPALEVGGLPLHLVRVGGEVTAKPCAEALLTARAVDRIAARGVMAVQSLKDGDAVRFARMQSIADPLTPIWTRRAAVANARH